MMHIPPPQSAWRQLREALDTARAANSAACNAASIRPGSVISHGEMVPWALNPVAGAVRAGVARGFFDRVAAAAWQGGAR